MQDVLGHFEIAILWELLRVPAVAVVHHPNENFAEVHSYSEYDRHYEIQNGQLDDFLAEHRFPAQAPQFALRLAIH